MSPATSAQLFPYGGDADDLQGPLGDDSSSPPLILTTPFTFFGKQHMEIIVKSLISANKFDKLYMHCGISESLYAIIYKALPS